MVGFTYVAAAAASGGRGSLWAPGLMLVASGMAMALWLENGHSTADLEFLGVTVLGLRTGGVLAAFMTRAGYDITAMSVAMTVMGFGGFVLAAQYDSQASPATSGFTGGCSCYGLVGVVKGRPSPPLRPEAASDEIVLAKARHRP